MKKNCLILFFLTCGIGLQAQNLDSLQRVVEKMPDDTLKVRKYFELAMKPLFQYKYLPAIALLEKQLPLAEKLKDSKGLFNANNALAICYSNMKNLPKLAQYANVAIKIFDESPLLQKLLPAKKNYVRLYRLFVELYVKEYDYANAQKYAFKQLEASKKCGFSGLVGNKLLGEIFNNQKNYVEALKYLNQALASADVNTDLGDLSDLYNVLGITSLEIKNFDEAIKYHNESLVIEKKLRRAFSTWRGLYNIADCYLSKKDYTKAAEYLNESAKYLDNPRKEMSAAYTNLGLAELAMESKNIAQAAEYGNIALRNAENSTDLILIQKAYGQQVEIQKAAKNYELAFLMAEKVKVLEDSSYKANLSKSTLELTKKYETEKKEQEIGFLTTENRLKQEKLRQEALLSAALTKENQLQDLKLLQSEELLTQGKELQLSLERSKQLEHQKLLKESQLRSVLEEENQLKESNLSQEQFIKKILILGLGLLAVFLGWLSVLYRRQQKAKHIIEEQAESLKILMREIHHRIRNNLQVISSMLRLQGRSISDETAQLALATSETRLQAIAMVHQKLYQSENSTFVSLKDYLQDLLETIKSQQDDQKIVTLEVADAQHIKVNLDTAVHLGLIVNELITNSFKYAFAELERGEIKVKLGKTPEAYQLTLKDNGPGLPNGQMVSSKTSLGMRLINILIKQLKGTIEYRHHRGGSQGAEFVLNFQAI